MKTHTTRLITAVWVTALAGGVFAQQTMESRQSPRPSQMVGTAQGDDLRIPRSPQNHLELAGLYQQVAVKQQLQAQQLRKSWASELDRLAPLVNKTGGELPWLTRRKRQAQMEIDEVERAATEAERAADYHRMRARELEGREFATLTAAVRRNPN